jgi:hypothetical protein
MQTEKGNQKEDRCNNSYRSVLSTASRSKRGSVLVEGVVGVLLVLPVLVICTVVIIDVILLVLYKQEIGAVANSAAAMACRFQPGPFFDTESTLHISAAERITEQKEIAFNFVQDELKAFGIPTDKLRDGFQLTYDKNLFLVTISFQVEGLKLIGLGPMLPQNLKLAESATAMLPCKVLPGKLDGIANSVPAGLMAEMLFPGYGLAKDTQLRFPSSTAQITFPNIHSPVTDHAP